MKKRKDFTWDTGWTLTRFSRLVHHFSGRVPTAPDWAGETAQPPMDVYEDGDGLLIEIEVPGMGREDLNVSIDRERISIEGFKREAEDSECLRYLCLERQSGVFRRITSLPVSVDTSAARASLENGILRIRLPKVRERRRGQVNVPIEIGAGRGRRDHERRKGQHR